jgi:hypothetical protein
MPTILNRNVITAADIAQLTGATKPGEVPKTLDVAPPAGSTSTTTGDQRAGTPGGVLVPTEDDYLTKPLVVRRSGVRLPEAACDTGESAMGITMGAKAGRQLPVQATQTAKMSA